MIEADALYTAIQSLGAHDLGNERYAIGRDEHWFICSKGHLLLTSGTPAQLHDDERIVRIKVKWWRPNRQFGWVIKGLKAVYATKDDARAAVIDSVPDSAFIRITVDLNTGEEIAA